MRTRLVVLVMLALVGCKSGLATRQEAVLLSAKPELVEGEVVVVVDVDFRKLPPGDPNQLFLTLGSNAMRELAAVSFNGEQLAGLTDPPTPSPPRPGERRRYRVPLPLTKKFEAKVGLKLDLLVNLEWGSNAEGPLHQSRLELDIASLYRTRAPGAPE